MGWSLWKLLILAAVVYYVWNWFRRQQLQSGRPAAPSDAGNAAPASGRRPKAVDLVKCPKCDSYVTQGSGHGCNRPDCPTL